MYMRALLLSFGFWVEGIGASLQSELAHAGNLTHINTLYIRINGTLFAFYDPTR
jgi:hypothetical protein